MPDGRNPDSRRPGTDPPQLSRVHPCVEHWPRCRRSRAVRRALWKVRRSRRGRVNQPSGSWAGQYR
jgi:hypothetical protein